MIPLRLFNQLSTSVIYLQSALYNGVWQIDLYFLPMYFQDVRGYTPLQNAMLMLPLLLTQSAGGIVAGQITSKLARYVTHLLLSPDYFKVANYWQTWTCDICWDCAMDSGSWLESHLFSNHTSRRVCNIIDHRRCWCRIYSPAT